MVNVVFYRQLLYPLHSGTWAEKFPSGEAHLIRTIKFSNVNGINRPGLKEAYNRLQHVFNQGGEKLADGAEGAFFLLTIVLLVI